MKFYRLAAPIYVWAGKKMAENCDGYIKKGSKMLDLGCGSGIVSREFARRFQVDVMGVDIVDLRVVPLRLQLINGRDLPFDDGSFDTILISYVLHHTKDPIAIIKEAKRVVKHGGHIIVFEDLFEGAFSKAICDIHGYTFKKIFDHDREGTGENFKNSREWRLIFEHLGLESVLEKRVSAHWHPVPKRLFIFRK